MVPQWLKMPGVDWKNARSNVLLAHGTRQSIAAEFAKYERKDEDWYRLLNKPDVLESLFVSTEEIVAGNRAAHKLNETLVRSYVSTMDENDPYFSLCKFCLEMKK
jgi:hypothetical protein